MLQVNSHHLTCSLSWPPCLLSWYLQCQKLYLVNEGCRGTTSNHGWIYWSNRASGFCENVTLRLLLTVFWYVKPKHYNITDIDFFSISLFSNILLADFACWEVMWPNKSLPMTHYMYRIHIKKELTGDKYMNWHLYIDIQLYITAKAVIVEE